MDYGTTIKGEFSERLNRFEAIVNIEGEPTLCHVKNTGRCRELLIPGAEVWLSPADSPKRKTKYDLITVRKGERLINMDSQAPNKVFAEWAKSDGCPFGIPDVLQAERRFENSRFDFYAEAMDRKIFIEVKGVTLEENGIVRFPDAPTERGVKHLRELVRAKEQGFCAYAAFVIQMEDVKYFEPNRATHPEFAEALQYAEENGVKLLAFDCRVTPNKLIPGNPVEIRL